MLKLSSPVSITSYVKLASLPSFGEILPHNNLCYLTGYGRTSSQPKFHFFLNLAESQCCSSCSPLLCLPTADGGMSTRMRQVLLRSVDHQTCTSSGWWGSTVKTNMICAGGGSQSGCNVSSLKWKILKRKKNKVLAAEQIAATPVQTICLCELKFKTEETCLFSKKLPRAFLFCKDIKMLVFLSSPVVLPF